ncbi:26S proteasome subunit RPN7-domain-containing protein [Clohesyomyces aquaticus]|uniref:COP9 signalosome complex subunit 1 n=1 Tax=Clohesyomyces aquaticus TaxID=1231657 RepID=A0A1Y2ABI2_9PLEO|nr:26S proteasome subunit RPN7-domain-containing protein [Clohesyomyces aquaticus]
MTSNVEQSPFFQQQRAKGAIVLKGTVHPQAHKDSSVTDAPPDPPKFDLDSYMSNYDGSTRIDRLHHIGATSTYLAVDAYRMAITEAKKGKDVKLYLALTDDFCKIAPDDPLALIDTAWAEKRNREVKTEMDKLEHELKSYKNNLIKESIRMGNEDLGHFYYATGDYTNAHKAYWRMREHCTSSKHLSDMALRLVYVSIAQKSWLSTQSQLVKVDASQMKGEEKLKLEPIVHACSGLVQMSTNNVRDAATQFLKTSPQYLTLEPAAGIVWQREVISGNDIAVYGGLCALGSMDRSDLQQKVLANGDFRNFLELEPHIRRAITLFCNSKYSACLELLEGYRTDYMLDVYLSKVLLTIYNNIRTKCIVQYFIPFSCVTLDEMAKKFQPTGVGMSIEDELEDMIDSGILDARIDLVDRLLISPPTNPRYTVHTDALAMAEKYDHTLRLRLTRLNMMSAGLAITQDKSQQNKDGLDSRLGGEGGIGASLRGLGSRIGFS